jgi:hypothetical protein
MTEMTQYTTSTPEPNETASIDARLSDLEPIAGEMTLAAADRLNIANEMALAEEERRKTREILNLLVAHMIKQEPQKKESSGAESEDEDRKFLTRSIIGQVTPVQDELRSVNLNDSLQKSGSKFNPYT